MAAGESVVVEEHGSLEFKVFLEKWNARHLSSFSLQPIAISRQRGYLISIPNVAGLENILVAIDFSLLECPFWQRLGVGPHGNFGRMMDQLELTRHGLEFLIALGLLNFQFEQGLVGSIA